ncbi:ATP-grasp domain-containing protein [Desulfosporosinus meridiei]|uniref:Biotin carboxylase n=1 Tax=Desulfosporosinus meridiei (strain ATCC BAA-275 / DSM 13257 / KCTC 12902 / NCIMB 13706 / S10) TaxID=768704 RepID=J7IZM6_DESMD|nr:ATP-grasp domain-containing protein [Desulfosporosinus meridiei]AFQ44171.1 biotin carboxylase [Desulfosporosinus meridiei DSM 13257]
MNNQALKTKSEETATRIYFNRCFSSTHKIIQRFLADNNSQKYELYISHVSPNIYLEEIADYFEVEPAIDGKDYADYCLDFCQKHNINIFIPRYNVSTLIKFKDLFENLGVKVMFVGNSETYQLLDNKLKTYEALKNKDILGIPKSFSVRNYPDFQMAEDQISKNGKTCLKPISGIGGDGFKLIIDTMSEEDELYKTTSSTIVKDRIVRILKNSNNLKPFMVMEYLEGDEYSIDCLANRGELIIAIPRRKLDLYRQNIEYREDLIELAQKLAKEFSLSYLFNIQIKYHRGKAYLIEINTRMSAGIHKSCFTGVNLLDLGIKLLMGKKVTTPENIRWGIQIRTTENYEVVNL